MKKILLPGFLLVCVMFLLAFDAHPVTNVEATGGGCNCPKGYTKVLLGPSGNQLLYKCVKAGEFDILLNCPYNPVPSPDCECPEEYVKSHNPIPGTNYIYTCSQPGQFDILIDCTP